MQIRTTDGTAEVSSNGKANTALGLGIAGLATSLLGGGINLFGNGLNNKSNDERPVTKAELDMSMQIARKDSEIALLQSEKTTDAKLVDVFREAATRDRDIRDLIALNKSEQAAVNAQQMAYNAAANASIDVLKSQVAGLSSVTKVYIPSSNVCQSSCGCCTCNQ